jgi:membrane-bound ClpP family serine protease
MIQRFSAPWWISLASASCLFGLLTYLLLRWTGAVNDDRLALYLLAGIGLGDALLAWVFEVMTPTRVTLSPGERRTASCELRSRAEVVSGFEDSDVGCVQVRGEIWKARIAKGQTVTLPAGSVLNVVDRDGLVLIVSQSDGHSGLPAS